MAGLYDPKVGLAIVQTPDAGVANSVNSNMQLSTSIDIIDQDGNGIGFIKQFSERHVRPTTLVRQLSAKDAGVPIEQAPGVYTITLDVQGFAIKERQVDGSLIRRIGGASTRRAMKVLTEQKFGFSLLYVEREPTSLIALDAVILLDCWLNNYTKTTTVDQALIAESASITVSKARRPQNYLAL